MACHSIGKRSTRLSRVICARRGHPRGRFRSSGSQHPLPLLLPPLRSRHRASRNPLASLRFARLLPNRRLRSWAESGAGSDPPPNVRSMAPQSGLMQALSCGVRGRPQPAPATRSIPAGRLVAPPAAAPHGGSQDLRRRPGPRRRRRRASAAWSKATCSAGVRSAATTAVRRCSLRARCGGSGAAPPSVRCFGSGARGRGFEGGRSIPSPAKCVHTGYAGPRALAREPASGPPPGETPDR